MKSKSRTRVMMVESAARFVVERLEVRRLLAGSPAVQTVTPAAGATGVALNMPVTVNVTLPNGRLNANTVIGANVVLHPTNNNTNEGVVPSVVNTTGGGDAIILTPSVNLMPNTQYTFAINSAVQDINGDAFTAYSETFTTGNTPPPVDQTMAFVKQALPTTTGTNFTDLVIGPDGKLYASTEDGRIFRFGINSDGSLTTPQVFTSLQTYEGGNRLITGFAFDPSSTAANPIIWVSNTFYALSGATNGQNFTSKLTVMSGPNLATVQDAIIDLPRSVSDHVNDQPIFQPGTRNLFFCQAGQNAYGAPDTTWGLRPETLLSAAILEVNTTLLNPAAGALNVLTPDAGGTYSPYAAGAPLTIYATGIRNAYAIYFDANGQLWAAANGSSSGGNTPAFSSSNPNQINGNRIDTGQPYAGPNVPGLTAVAQAEADILIRVEQGGYYGHPNPTRGEYVLDDGNPTSGGVPGLTFSAYPSGTNPDPNYRVNDITVLGVHISPDSIFDYTAPTNGSNPFGGALNGKFLITEYSAGDDIAVVTHDANNNITAINRSITGLNGFSNPLGLVENPVNGYLYVSELGSSKITLLKPTSVAPAITASTTALAFNSAIAGSTNAGPSHTESVTVTNNGANALIFDSGAISIVGDGSSDSSPGAFTFVGSLPTTLSAGQSATIQVHYTATVVGTQSAILHIGSNDPVTPNLSISLNGIGTNGQFGYNEPSLVQVLRANNIPTIVGAGPNDVNSTNPTYPFSPDPSSQEVPMSRMVAADSDLPVTITPLASFDPAVQPSVDFGYYTPGDPSDATELFSISKTDAQTMYPTLQGASSFMPGTSEFGLYGTFFGVSSAPANALNIHYSEDSLNVGLDPVNPRKFRFFPMENAAGGMIPNTYIVAAEDGDDTTFNSFVNFVGVISNVMPAPNAKNAPVFGLTNTDGFPSTTTMAFSRIQIPNATTPDIVHDTSVLQINNTGDKPLIINGLTLSDTTNWELVNPPAAGTSVPAGGSLGLTIKFIATADPPHTDNEINDTVTTNGISTTAAGGVWTGNLTISTNDPVTPTRTELLKGFWQYQSEHENEPGLQTMVNNMFQLNTNISNTVMPDYPNNGKTVVTYGSEVLSGLWNAANTGLPVAMMQLAAYHNQYSTVTPGMQTQPRFGWYASGSSTTTFISTDAVMNAQTIFPLATGSSSIDAATFTPGGTFGFNIDSEKSQDALNTVDINTYGRSGHALRFYPLVNAQGVLVPNTYIIAVEYMNGPNSNSDYQDLLYLVSNITPSTMPATPTDVQASVGTKAGVNVQWAPASGAASYNVYRSVNGGASTKIANVTGINYVDTAAPSGQTVAYTVTAVNSSKVESFGMSSTIALFGTGAPPVSPTPPATPVIQQADASTGTDVVVTWGAATGASSYIVERQGPGDSGFVQVATGITGTTYTDTNVVQNATYAYEVQAQNSAGVSGLSAPVSATVPQPPTLPTPTNPQADASSGTQVVLSWGASAGAATYIVQRETMGTTIFAQVANVATTTFTDTGVVPGTTYLYRIQAVNGSSFSAYSMTVQAALAGPAFTLPVTIGKGTNKAVFFTDANGTLVTIKLAGAGTATVNFGASTQPSSTATKAGVVVSATGIVVTSITTTGTNVATSLNITTKGGNGTVSIGAITVDASIRAINARTSTLIGALSIVGAANKIALGAANASAMTVGGSLQTLQIASASGVSLSAVGAIHSIVAGTWDSNAVISAPAISSIAVAGDATFDISTGAIHSLKVRGTLSNSTVTLSAVGGLDLAMLTAGAITGTSINAAGNMGTISSNMLSGSQIFAGVGPLAAGQTLPAAPADFVSQAFIANVNLKKRVGVVGDTDSSIAASLVKHASLGIVQYNNNGQHFGIAGNSIAQLTFADPSTTKSYTFKNLISQAVVTADIAGTGIVPQDFTIQIV